MSSEGAGTQRKLRTLLILGRVSNIPTVWSNCLAGWMLGGGGSVTRFLILCFGGSCLYIGGMFLNDAFDAEFDRKYRRSRPIPSGAISEREVWRWGLGLMGVGVLSLDFFNWKTTVLAALTIAAVIVYDALHKSVSFAPILMALCRFFLLLVAVSASAHGLSVIGLWCAGALGIYIAAVSYVARGESSGGTSSYGPAWLLGSPVVVSLVVNTATPIGLRGLLSVVLVGWCLQSLRHLRPQAGRRIERTVSELLAGIVFVDLLAVSGGSPAAAAIFVCLFVGALLMQRFIPAT